MDALLVSARGIVDACHADDPRRNSGLAFGAVIAAAAFAGRDKLTLSLPPRLEPFGSWVEPLVAESTGKQGKGIVPIPGEPHSFGVLELAQAVGDFESLNRTGRSALHLHLPRRDPDMLRRIGEPLTRAD